MGLLTKAQHITGDKTFDDNVIVAKDLVLKRHATLYAPVTSEPSLGTPHTHIETLLNTDPADASAHTITVSNAPVGAKMIAGYFSCRSGTAGRSMDILDMAGNIWCRQQNPTTTIFGFGWFQVSLDSNRQFQWQVSNADVTSAEIYMRLYWL